MESLVVRSSTNAQSNLISEIRHWIFKQLNEVGCSLKGATIDILPLDANRELSLPPSNKWKQEMKTESWRALVKSIRSTGTGTWEYVDGNASITISPHRDGYLLGGNPIPNLPNRVEDHPVYRAIKRKGAQARKWDKEVRSKPIVLVIGTEDISPEFGIYDSGSGVELDQAIWSALLDAHKIGFIDRYNILRDGSLERVQSKQVSGARYISGVMFVRLEHMIRPLDYTKNRIAKSRLFRNPHADILLTEAHTAILDDIDFNRIPYGPGTEAWEGTHRQSLRERNVRRGGSLVMRSGRDIGYSIELPAITIVRLLAGDISAENLSSDYGNDPSLIKLFKKALNENCEIIDVALIQSDPLIREEPRIRFQFGIPKPPVVARTKSNQ